MRISDVLLQEFEHEMASTRKMLERLPAAKWNWKPHAKSFSMSELAAHVANIPSWIVDTIGKDSLDFAPAGGEPYKTPQFDTPAALVAAFDQAVAAGSAALTGAENDHMMKNWTLLAGGHVILTMPRTAVVRSFVLNHLYHHRGQLSVYLRLNDVPVPGMYGPTADEPGM